MSIGGTSRGANVSTNAAADTILAGGTGAFGALGPAAANKLDKNLTAAAVGDLAAQMLALRLNQACVFGGTNTGNLTLSQLGIKGGDISGTGLTLTTTVNQVMTQANTTLDQTVSTVNGSKNGVSNLTIVLGKINRINTVP
jgi:hypothetical protein